jgi:transcriptional regulator with XRE-family HTH domain
MRDLEVGRLLRMLRIRRDWRLQDVAARCGLSRATIGRDELGSIASVPVIRAHAAVFDIRVEWRIVGRGADVARLLDEEHAAIVETMAAALARNGWQVEAEVSYSEYGERGRIDLLAFDLGSRVLAAIEVKTALADLQETLGSLHAKARLAPAIGSRCGWTSSRVVTILVVAATAANRSIVSSHPALFSAFGQRWLRGPRLPQLGGNRLLLWIPAAAAGRRSWLAGRRRVRRKIPLDIGVTPRSRVASQRGRSRDTRE